MSSVDEVRSRRIKVYREISRVVVGMHDVIKFSFATVLIGGHVLLEGPPGIAKTFFAKNFANVLGVDFRRVQMTPDILPADIIGTYIRDESKKDFVFKPGPIFTNVLLIDEINRAPPKTQSALLEAMEEKQVTVGGVTHKLPEPFFVIATQNPIEIEGTRPLGEAQISRFTVKIELSYPSPDDELKIIRLKNEDIRPTPTSRILDGETIMRLRRIVWKDVYVSDAIMRYIRDIIVTCRRHPYVRGGPSPRGSIALLGLSKAFAAMSGRPYVIPDDVIEAARRAVHHRLILKPEAELEGITGMSIVDQVLQQIPVP